MRSSIKVKLLLCIIFLPTLAHALDESYNSLFLGECTPVKEPPAQPTGKSNLKASLSAGLAGATTWALLNYIKFLPENTRQANIVNLGAIACASLLGWSLAHQETTEDTINYIDVLKGLSASIISLVSWNIVYRYTPNGRLQRAKKKINKIDQDMLGMATMSQNSQEFYSRVDSSYARYAFPRVICFNYYKTMQEELLKAQDLLTSAEKNQEIQQECKHLLKTIHSYLILIEKAQQTLKDDPQWFQRISAYNVEQIRIMQEKTYNEIMMQGIQNSMDSMHHSYQYRQQDEKINQLSQSIQSHQKSINVLNERTSLKG